MENIKPRAPEPEKEFFVLDLDRTLLKTPEIIDKLYNFLDAQGVVSSQAMKQAQQSCEDRGESFDPVTYVCEKYGVKWDNLQAEFLAEVAATGEDEYLLDGAVDLLTLLRDKGLPHGILTYGGEEWQKCKLSLPMLHNVLSEITQEKDKGRLIAEWYDSEQGVFRTSLALGNVCVQRVCLIDDKAASFASLPEENARGFWIPSGKRLSSQDTMPPTVKSVDNLRDVITSIYKSPSS